MGTPTPAVRSISSPTRYAQWPANRLVCGLTENLQVEWFNLMAQPIVLGCIKISIICFYGRIFDAKRRGLFHTILRVFIGLIVVWIVAFFFAMLFLCGASPSAFWAPYIVTLKTCSDGHYLWILEAFAYTDFLFDVAVFFLPIPRVGIFSPPIFAVCTNDRRDLGIAHAHATSPTSDCCFRCRSVVRPKGHVSSISLTRLEQGDCWIDSSSRDCRCRQ